MRSQLTGEDIQVRKLVCRLILFPLAALVVASCCGHRPHVTYPETDLRPPVPLALVRKVIVSCRSSSDCQKTAPKCADLNNTPCDLQTGTCNYYVDTTESGCHCYDKQIRYCDYPIGNEDACQPPLPMGCGIQKCVATTGGADWEDDCVALPQTQWPCGKYGEPCCGASSCFEGLLCEAGHCVPCGGSDRRCKPGANAPQHCALNIWVDEPACARSSYPPDQGHS